MKKTLVIYFKDEKYGKPLKYPEIVRLPYESLVCDMDKWEEMTKTSDNAIMFETEHEADIWIYALEFRRMWYSDFINGNLKDYQIQKHNYATLKYPECFV